MQRFSGFISKNEKCWAWRPQSSTASRNTSLRCAVRSSLDHAVLPMQGFSVKQTRMLTIVNKVHKAANGQGQRSHIHENDEALSLNNKPFWWGRHTWDQQRMSLELRTIPDYIMWIPVQIPQRCQNLWHLWGLAWPAKNRKNRPWSIAENCVENNSSSTWVPVRQPGSEKQDAAFSSLRSCCHWKPLLHAAITRSFLPLLQHLPRLKAHQIHHLCWCNHPRNTAVKTGQKHQQTSCIKPKVPG